MQTTRTWGVGGCVFMLGLIAWGRALAQDATLSNAAASSAEEVLARQLVAMKEERAVAAKQYGSDDAKLKAIDERISDVREQLAARSRASLLLTDEAPQLASMMPPPVFPRIVAGSGGAAEVLPAESTSEKMAASSASAPRVVSVDPDTEANAAARDQLEKAQVSLAATDMPLSRVLQTIKGQTKCSFDVNWKALQTAGIEQNTPVTATLNQVSAPRALAVVLAQVGGGNANLWYTADSGVIVISTRDDLNSGRFQTVSVYNVRDLLGSESLGQYPQSIAAALYEQLATTLTDTIKATVARDTWVDNGGTVGSIRMFNGMMIVAQTRDNQRQVERMLNALRSAGR